MAMSETSYSYNTIYPIYSSDQGAKNPPTISFLIRSMLSDMYESKATGSGFVSPDQGCYVILAILGFVDNMTKQVN
eukprot:13271972-Ditylum_brightwellii.AAC.1